MFFFHLSVCENGLYLFRYFSCIGVPFLLLAISIDRLLSTNAMVLNLFHVLHFDTDYCCVKVNFFNEFLCPTSVLMEHLPTLVELRSHNLHVPLLSLPYTQARNRLGGGFFLARSGGG